MVNIYNPCYTPEGQTAGPAYCIGTNNVKYTGPNLPNTGIETNDNVTVALQKIDEALDPIELVQTLITAINQNPSLQVMFCTLVNSCGITPTTTSTSTSTSTTSTSTSTTSTTTTATPTTTTTTTTASVTSQQGISSTSPSLLCQGIGGGVLVFYDGNIGLPSAPLYTDSGLTFPYNQSFFGTYIRLYFNGEYNLCIMSGNVIQSYTPCPTTTTTTTTIP
jgi:hypothetical protein